MKYAILLSVLLLSACATGGRDAPGHGDTGDLVHYARSLVGTPYRYGGDSPRSGFDCSGYVAHVYRHAMGITLPRSVQQISRHGHAIRMNQLREGDLLFYDTNHAAFSHVGIYLGDERFIHAPSSGGRVRIENMRGKYWQKHYSGARRITF